MLSIVAGTLGAGGRGGGGRQDRRWPPGRGAGRGGGRARRQRWGRGAIQGLKSDTITLSVGVVAPINGA